MARSLIWYFAAGTSNGEWGEEQGAKFCHKFIRHVEVGEEILNNGNIDDFGMLLDETWHYKKEINKNITNNKIDEMYLEAKKHGALGGKLLGAGGGGFLIFYMKKKEKKSFLKKNKNIVHVPFKFSEFGREIIFNKGNK